MEKYKSAAAELFGTYCLVFAGTGAIISNELTNGQVTHVGIGLTFGLVVMAMIYSLGDISGAHLNPAVTLGFWMARKFPAPQVALYMGAQGLGAIAASATLRLILGAEHSMGVTQPANQIWQAFILEIVLSWILMFVILQVSTGSKEKGIMAGTAIGATVGFEALFGGPISGASMNPARSLGPALLAGNLSYLWIYLSAPCLGAGLAVLLCRWTRTGNCCGGDC